LSGQRQCDKPNKKTKHHEEGSVLDSEASRDELSRRYGGVLFDLASENKELKKVLKEAHFLHETIHKEQRAWAQLVSPTTPLHLQGRMIADLIRSLKLGNLMSRFLKVLCENRRLPKLSSILEAFFDRAQKAEGILKGVLETPTKLTQKEIESLQKVLTGQLQKEVILNQRIKESLMAGVVLRLGSIMIDTSLGTQLMKLRHVMER
jgi:F-type H+-transporting ATPase subunit delta